MDQLIITVAVSGSGPTRKDNPNVPYSPEEIADEVVRCREAGASIAHVQPMCTCATPRQVHHLSNWNIFAKCESGCDPSVISCSTARPVASF